MFVYMDFCYPLLTILQQALLRLVQCLVMYDRGSKMSGMWKWKTLVVNTCTELESHYVKSH